MLAAYVFSLFTFVIGVVVGDYHADKSFKGGEYDGSKNA